MKIIIFIIAAFTTYHNAIFASSSTAPASPTDAQFSNVAEDLYQSVANTLQKMKRPPEIKSKSGQTVKETPEQAVYTKNTIRLRAITACKQEANAESSPTIKLIKHFKCTIIALYENIQKESISRDLLAADSSSHSDENVVKARQFCLYTLSNNSNTTSCKNKGRIYWDLAKTSTTANDKIMNYMKCYFIAADFTCQANDNTGLCTISPPPVSGA